MGDGDGRDGRGVTGECSCLGVYAVAGGLWVDAYEVYACELMRSRRGKGLMEDCISCFIRRGG